MKHLIARLLRSIINREASRIIYWARNQKIITDEQSYELYPLFDPTQKSCLVGRKDLP